MLQLVGSTLLPIPCVINFTFLIFKKIYFLNLIILFIYFVIRSLAPPARKLATGSPSPLHKNGKQTLVDAKRKVGRVK